MTIPSEERLQIALSLYEVQHMLLQSYRQIYLTVEAFLLAAAAILRTVPATSGLQIGPIILGIGLCIVWWGQCCQRRRSWRWFRGIIRRYEESGSLPESILGEYADRFRGVGWRRQRAILVRLGSKRRWCPLRWSPALIIDNVIPLVFFGVWITFLMVRPV
jgi:hypothetical protein